MSTDEHQDEAYQRLHATGPEFEGFLANHGPMAADALVRLGRSDAVEGWVTTYVTRLEALPAPRWRIDAADWRDHLGDASRLGDWLDFFDRAVQEEDWQAVLVRWWPRLLPGALASATHGLIRSGHAVRAVMERPTPQRVRELGQALAYWAARWQPLPGTPHPGGTLAPVGDAGVLPALDLLVDAAIDGYASWADGNPVMLVHAVTAPRAAALVVPALPREMWRDTYATAWAVSAAITAMYRPSRPDLLGPDSLGPDSPGPRSLSDVHDVVDRTVRHADEHVIKLVEVALESHRRGNPAALVAAERALGLIAPA